MSAIKEATFEIVAGTYEEYLLGYFFVKKQNELIQSFAAHDHNSSLRAVTISDNYVASGGADDRIFIYDLRTRKELCMLTHHDSTINCLQFTESHSHLMAGSADGVLTMTRVGNWQLEKIWDKAHKGSAIYDIAIHPSGKLALTLGADQCLRTWNLIKGRQAYAINLKTKSKDAKSLEKIVWAPDGVRFVLVGGKFVEIWSIETGGVLHIIDFEEKVFSAIFQSENMLLVGTEEGHIVSINTDTFSKEIHKIYDSRVKSIAKYKKWIVTACSAGTIKVFNEKLRELASIDSGCRITCLTAVPVLVKKEEKEEKSNTNAEIVEKPVVKRTRSVVVEVEDDDEEESYTEKQIGKIKRKSKNVDEFKGDINEKDQSIVKKKKKRKNK